MSRTYYYIDYRATIDAIKWRVYSISKQVQGTTVPREERKAFYCRRCKSEWTLLEVLDTFNKAGFFCHKCDFLLNEVTDEDHGGHEQSTKLNAQFRFITDLLPKLDSVLIPENTFEQAFASARKVQRDESNPAYETQPISSAANPPTAVKGLTNTGPTSIAVTLTDGPTEAEIAAEKALKEKIAKQNAMPVHFTHSTVSGEQVKFGSQSSLQTSIIPDEKKSIGSETPDPSNNSTEIDDYFANLKAQQAKEAAELVKEEEETDSEEEDEEGFEDVLASGTGTGDAATPASASASANGTGEAKPVIGLGVSEVKNGIKRDSGSISGSGSSTNVTSPATGPGTPNVEERAVKRVRVEEPVVEKTETAVTTLEEKTETKVDAEKAEVKVEETTVTKSDGEIKVETKTEKVEVEAETKPEVKEEEEEEEEEEESEEDMEFEDV